MNKKVRKILGATSTASLILAGSLPLLAQITDPPTTCTRAKSKKVESSKTKENAASKKKVEKNAPAKTAPAKAKTAK